MNEAREPTSAAKSAKAAAQGLGGWDADGHGANVDGADFPPPDCCPLDAPRGFARWGPLLIALVSLLLLALLWWFYYGHYPSRIGPSQPIPFSHRFHVGTKDISCIMCHNGVADSPRAGLPELETCMLCHQRIITAHPWIERLREHYDQGVPVAWRRVNDLPEFVFFTHERHVRRAVDCGQCHGNVQGMDRVELFQSFNKMGFCVQCHRDNDVSHDCFVCHR